MKQRITVKQRYELKGERQGKLIGWCVDKEILMVGLPQIPALSIVR